MNELERVVADRVISMEFTMINVFTNEEVKTKGEMILLNWVLLLSTGFFIDTCEE